jgi:hypothetical protein
MVDAIGSTSTDTWTPSLDEEDDEARRRMTTATTSRTVIPPEPPPGPDIDGAVLVRAAHAGSPRPLLAMGIEASPPSNDQDTVVQRRLDAFRESATPTYHLPGGTEVAVATPFRMAGYPASEALVQANRAELAALVREHGMGPLYPFTIGRATPEQIQVLTQALVDRGRLPPSDGKLTPAERVRRMMTEYGLGCDCAGYTQQAFLAARGLTRAQAGFAPDRTGESLSSLPRPPFVRVAPGDARAGDIVVLDAPRGESVGHRLIVYDRRDASTEYLAGLHGDEGDLTKLRSGRVSILQVDSSFGSGGDPQRGGVQRQTWLYDAASNQWGRVSADDHVVMTGLPYDGQHPLRGIFHYPEKH